MGDDWNIAFYRAQLSPEPRDPVTPRALRNANIGRDYWEVSLKNIADGCSHKAQIQELVKNIHIDERGGKGALFIGPYGHGKTSCSIICLKAAMARGGQAYLEPAVMLERAFEKANFYLTPEGLPVWDMLTKCQFVALDDLGSELVTSGYKAGDNRVIEAFIRARYNNRLPTYITTNKDLDSLLTTYAGVKSILKDPSRYTIIDVRGKNWRKGS